MRTMQVLTTKGIKVSVETTFHGEHSDQGSLACVHSYRVTIENNTHAPVQLLRRYWRISDSNLITREIEGEGVIGEQPIIQPGHRHVYSSWTQFMTSVGKMSGYYQMINLDDGEIFNIGIPEFTMMSTSASN